MQRIYQVTIHGRTLESRDLKKLLARAVSEKRVMDRRVRLYSDVHQPPSSMHAAQHSVQCLSD